MADKFRTQNGPLTGAVFFQCIMPDVDWFWAEVADALNTMTNPDNWQVDGDVTVDEAVEAAVEMARNFIQGTPAMNPIGTVFAHCLANVPAKALACDGSTYLKADYPDLAAILDSAFSVDSTHFKVPDLRGRTIIGTGQGSGLTNRAIDASGGEEAHTLTTAEIPTHNHGINMNGALVVAPGEMTVIIPWVTSIFTTGNTGGGGSHNNMQPYLALKYAIWAEL